MSAVTWGTYNERESKTCTDPTRINSAVFVESGDFLFSRANTIELVGTCVIATEVTQKIMLSDKILRLKLIGIDPWWVLYSLRSPHGRREIEERASGNQASMRNIGQERLRQIAIPIPPKEELAEVLRLLRSHMTALESLESQIRSSQRTLSDIEPSILAKAFRGELAPQDPDDEPAEVLLERIRGARAAAAPAKHKRKSGPKREKAPKRVEAGPNGTAAVLESLKLPSLRRIAGQAGVEIPNGRSRESAKAVLATIPLESLLEHFQVAELQSACQLLELNKRGRKADLVKRILKAKSRPSQPPSS